MNTDAAAAETVTATIKLVGDDWEMQTKVTVPTAPITMRDMLPMIQSLANSVVDAAAQVSENNGRKISCQKGCGACCRQLVPISEPEARHIGQLVEDMPEPRRAEVRARFADARERLQASGLLEKLQNRADWVAGQTRSLGLEYFAQRIPCPFLEDESCSIHLDRPVACREYLVTSPAEFCSRPTAETVEQVKLPCKVWSAIARCDEPARGARSIRWVPLVLAPEWSEANPDEPPPKPGPELLREFFGHLTRQSQKGPSPGESAC